MSRQKKVHNQFYRRLNTFTSPALRQSPRKTHHRGRGCAVLLCEHIKLARSLHTQRFWTHHAIVRGRLQHDPPLSLRTITRRPRAFLKEERRVVGLARAQAQALSTPARRPSVARSPGGRFDIKENLFVSGACAWARGQGGCERLAAPSPQKTGGAAPSPLGLAKLSYASAASGARSRK